MIRRLKEFIFKNKTFRQTMAKNVFWLGIGQFGSRLIRSAITIYSARLLGATEYGIFSYALGIASFFTVFSDIGTSVILTREVAKEPEKQRNYFATVFIIRTFLLVFTAVLLIAIAPRFIKIEKAAYLMPFVALLTVLDGFRDFAYSFFKGKEKMELEAIVTFAVNLAVTVFGFIALSISPISATLLKVYIAGSLIGFLMTVYLLREEYRGIIKYFSKKLIKSIIQAAWPMAAGGLVGAFMSNVDILMLGWWRTASEIGFYSVGQKIVGMLYIIGGLIPTAIYPAISRIIQENNKERISSVISKTMIMVLLMAIPLSIGGVILADQIIKLVFGANYLNSIPVFRIMILSLMFIYSLSVFNIVILGFNKQAKLFWYAIVATLTNIILNAVLIPHYGISGAAVATLFANALNVFFLWRVVKKLNNFVILRDMKKIIMAVLGMAVMVIFLKYLGIMVVINVIISGAFYLFMLYALKERNFKELLFLFHIL